MTALLQLEGVEARYGAVRALHGITLEVGEGEIVAVLGANGAGKTTTLRAISGTVRRSGKLVFDGKQLRAGPEAVARAGIAHAAPSPSSPCSRTCGSAPTRGASAT